jgi:hypothetical protein
MAMIRKERELKLGFLELLLDNDLPADSDLTRALMSTPGTSFRSSTWPREISPTKADGSKFLEESHAQLKDTSISTNGANGSPGTKLELVEAKFDPSTMTSGESGSGDGGVAGEGFVSGEMTRISSVLENLGDGDSDQLLEVANQRIQLLTNLGKIAESSGARSKLGSTLKAATADEQRLAIVRQLFGDEVLRHWAPAKSADLAFAISGAVDNDPVTVLRDTTGRFSSDQKKLAFFAFLSRSATLTENQEIWLASIAEGNLR